jgi:hypothetical protein
MAVKYLRSRCIYRAHNAFEAIHESFVRALDRLFRDPLTLDLDGDGIETVAAGVLFDHTGEGRRAATGWVGPDDGYLVLDRNGNGTIDDGRELPDMAGSGYLRDLREAA